MDPTTRCNVYQWVILWIKWAANGMWNEAVPGLFDSRTPASSALRSRQHKPSTLLIYVRVCVFVMSNQLCVPWTLKAWKCCKIKVKLQIWRSSIIAKYHKACSMCKFYVIIGRPLLGAIIVPQTLNYQAPHRVVCMTDCTWFYVHCVIITQLYISNIMDAHESFRAVNHWDGSVRVALACTKRTITYHNAMMCLIIKSDRHSLNHLAVKCLLCVSHVTSGDQIKNARDAWRVKHRSNPLLHSVTDTAARAITSHAMTISYEFKVATLTSRLADYQLLSK